MKEEKIAIKVRAVTVHFTDSWKLREINHWTLQKWIAVASSGQLKQMHVAHKKFYQ